MVLGRRELLAGLSALATPCAPLPASAAAMPLLEQVDLQLPGDKKIARRCLLLVPRQIPPKRLLVLCHGLGETIDERLGIEAWAKPYGLLKAYERLSNPPLARILPKVKYVTDEHLEELNRELAARPFQGLAVACPFTPNVYEAPSKVGALDRYASWIGDTLLPELKNRLSLPLTAPSVGLDGVSLGGYVALEVFLRRPELFGVVGCVQGALRLAAADGFAKRLAEACDKVGARPMRVATSRDDPFRAPSERLAKGLRERGLRVTFSLTPGPHSQTWLREIGSLELLHFYDRTLVA